MKGSKLSITLAATALAVALFAATPISQAAGRLVLGKNSVGTAQLKKNAVTTVKVRNGSLLTAEFKAGQLPAGPQGPKGDPGATGPTGLTGPTGPSDGFVSSTIGPITINGATTIRSLTLPPGRYVLSGRATLQTSQLQIVRCGFYPSGTGLDASAVVDVVGEAGISLVDTESLSNSTTVNLRCNGGYIAKAYSPVMTAIRVGTLTTQ